MPSIISSRQFDPGESSLSFWQQWRAPGDVFSVLLLLGGDVINRALAQITGSIISPVAFSFGWAAYAVSAVMTAMGENKLLPPTDCMCKVINASNGFVHDNQSWIIGRIVRDFDYWCDPSVTKQVQLMLDGGWQIHKKKYGAKVQRPVQAGLCVAVYRALDGRPGCPGYDHVYFSGFAVMLLQFGIAAIPCAEFGEWSIFMITVAGTILAFGSGSLSQWSKEKWACGLASKNTVILTRGQGSQYAIVIRGMKRGFDLEDLSSGGSHVSSLTGRFTRVFVTIMAVLWILLLVTAAGIHDHTWYLLGVGAVGMLHNLYIAGARRRPEAFGMPLEFERVIGEPKVMQTLYAVEAAYPAVGKSMLRTFFPGELRPEEKEQWGTT